MLLRVTHHITSRAVGDRRQDPLPVVLRSPRLQAREHSLLERQGQRRPVLAPGLLLVDRRDLEGDPSSSARASAARFSRQACSSSTGGISRVTTSSWRSRPYRLPNDPGGGEAMSPGGAEAVAAA